MKREENERVQTLKLKERRDKIERLFSQSELGDRYKNVTFDDWEPRPGTEKWLGKARDYVDNFKAYKSEGRGMVVMGSVGNGKTLLLAAILNALLAQDVIVIHRGVPSLLSKIKSTFDPQPKTTVSEIHAAINDADLLMLDDLGAEQTVRVQGEERMSDFAESQLYEIIDDRYRWKRPVIVTTNYDTTNKFKVRVGERIYDRLLETCDFVGVTASSYRKEIARRNTSGS
jgi:DNA replication protein DnaC